MHAFRPNRLLRRRGFTLVEMLVVIGMILLLIGILLPAVNRAYIYGVRSRIQADLQAITIALDHYKSEHSDFPRTSPSGEAPQVKGAVLLCRAMVGPADVGVDGADGPGFRTQTAIGGEVQGKVYGPYLPADRFKIIAYPNGGTLNSTKSDACLADRNGKPILYYPGLTGSDPKSSAARNGYVKAVTYSPAASSRPMFDASDNIDLMTTVKLQHMLGDTSHNGAITGSERAEYLGDYILLSAGPDEQYGPASTTTPVNSKNPCDDVTNYER